MIPIEENISLADKTTYRIGGPARYYCSIRAMHDLPDALQWVRRLSVPCFILGKGSNILVSQEGFDGLVIDLSGFDRITWNDTNAECCAGALVANLVWESVDKGLAGAEELAGIPGSVGGGLIMNAGAFNQTISDCLVEAWGVDIKSYAEFRLKKEEIRFGYRYSSLHTGTQIVTGCRFDFTLAPRKQLVEVYREILKKRNEKQPLNQPNCGSVFKRPPGNFAGALIEACGLKGHRIGGARISPKHANFIVNLDNANAEDVRALIELCREKVYKTSGILLEPEVIFVGRFKTGSFQPAR